MATNKKPKEKKPRAVKETRKIEVCVNCPFADLRMNMKSYCKKYNTEIEDIYNKPDWCKVKWIIVIFENK